MKKTAFFVIALITLNSQSQELESFFEQTDSFLKAYVQNGRVAYDKIKSSPSELENILALAKDIKVSESEPNTYQAFWINAYNLSVIKGILDNYPLKSPLDKPGFFDKTTYELAGKSITLNDIEHKLLRAKFKDARFHFVLVCGAIGCPPLIGNAYLPTTLGSQLETQTKLALNGTFLKVNSKKKRVEGSEILKWYKEDFILNHDSEIDFINEYRTEKIPQNYRLTYFTYNWNLNKQ